DHALEDSSHLFFGCFMAKDVQKLICRLWNLDFQSFDSYDGWLSWFKSIRLVVLSNMGDRRFWDLNGDGCFCAKDVRRMLEDTLLPKFDVPSRWVKHIPIKVNVLAWKISMDRLPTRVNLHQRGVHVSPISCPICCEALENLDHLLFCCDLAKDIARSICNWWGLVWNPVNSYRSWLSWFNSFNQVRNRCWNECFTLPGLVI
nr:hypothetical protein [Tanacetum cinerariifolium]